MPDDLYTADILLWSGQQADLLRRLARGERVNDAIDWDNLIEEVESVGQSQLQAVESLLARAVEHLLKIHGWPDGPTAKWRNEVVVFLRDARKRYVPSMRQALSVDELYLESIETIAQMTYQSRSPRLPHPVCPFTLDALIVPRPGRPDLDALLAMLDPPPPETR